MQLVQLDFHSIPQFSEIDKAYTTGNQALRPFYEYETDIASFGEIIKQRGFEKEKRCLLVDELKRQYTALESSAATQQNIDRLNEERCFTIVTAHQPNLFTGPLYSIYKIVSAINLAKQLNAEYTDCHFVPVFWTGGEDHDFEEVNHLHLFGNKIEWTDAQGGAVGQYQLDSLESVIEQVVNILGNGDNTKELSDKIRAFYTNSPNYGMAHRRLVNWIFKDYGLVICNGNTRAFKRQLKPIVEDELTQHHSQKILQKTAEELQQAGFSNQAYVREINLFYHTTNKRSRIVKENDTYRVLDTDLVFSKEALLADFDEHPERFSPNVILRPLFQELILPNLAYIGGGGELAYWLERKEQFAFFDIPFPMLVRRCSVLWIHKQQHKKMEKLGLSVPQLLEDTHTLLKTFVLENSDKELTFGRQIGALKQVFKEILDKSLTIDKGMKKAVLGTEQQTINAIKKLEKKLIRAEKQQNETAVNQIKKIKQKLFPEKGLQERHDNFLAYYSRYGQSFLDTLMEHLHPLEKKFLVLIAD